MSNETSKVDEAMLSKGWVTLAVAREKLGVSTSSIYRMVERGTLSSTVAAGKKYVSIASCVAFLGPEASVAMGLAKPPGGRPRPSAPPEAPKAG